jgi:hypothetical protein
MTKDEVEKLALEVEALRLDRDKRKLQYEIEIDALRNEVEKAKLNLELETIKRQKDNRND